MSWAAPLRLALSLGIPPESFWRLSLVEWRLLTEAPPQPESFWRLSLVEWRLLTEAPPQPVLTRSGLTDLIARYPDEEACHEL